MQHFTRPSFWQYYYQLPLPIQRIADKQYKRLREDPLHPSLRLKKVGQFWSARVTDNYRALALRVEGDFVWFWIGTHDEYERLLK
jgi:hypothetical protein